MNIKQRLASIVVRWLSPELKNVVASEIQQVSGGSNQRVESLRQQFENLRHDINLLGPALRQDDLAYAAMLREEIANAVEMLRQEDINLVNRTKGEINSQLLATMDQMMDRLTAIIFETRRVACSQKWIEGNPVTENPSLSNAESFDIYLQKFKALHPKLFDIWSSINFGKNITEFKERPEISCGVPDRITARYFAGFIAPYLTGKVLDIGCGPYAKPYYLGKYPNDCINGIDPIEPFEKHPFHFVRGFGEFLPWSDNQFDVVIAATSLDHTLSLDIALEQIRRVLKPGGIFLVWEWFADHAEPYQPDQQDAKLIDNFHLFNFDEKWFEELMTKHFQVEEKVKLFAEWKHYYFYALKLKG